MIATPKQKLPAGAAQSPWARGDWWQGLEATKPAAAKATTAAASATPTTPGATPAGASSTLNWWENPGYSWTGNNAYTGHAAGVVGTPPAGQNQTFQGGVGAPVAGTATLPDWAASYGFADPKGFYDFYHSLNPGDAKLWAAGAQSTHQSIQKEEAARAAAINTLSGQRTGVQNQFAAWQNDPARQSQRQNWLTMTEPGYEAIGGAEQRGMEQELAQGYARAGANMQARAGATGNTRSGVANQRQAQLQGLADAGGVQLKAQVSAANEQMRREAMRTLQSVDASDQQVNLAYQNLISGISDQIAGYETSLDYVPSDPAAWAALGEARESRDQEYNFRREALDRAEAASQDSIFDTVLKLATAFPGASQSLIFDLLLGGGGNK
jgi:hypothetical protein